jgi:uncharacterized protein YraI
MKYQLGLLVILLIMLVGCNFEMDEDKNNLQPTLGTPIIWAGSPTATLTVSAKVQATDTSVPPTASVALLPTFTPVTNPTTTPEPTTAPSVPLTLTIAPPVIPTSTPVPPSTSTPAILSTIAPAPTLVPSSPPPTAQVCANCGNLRLRTSPGTAGTVTEYLEANTPVTIIGRTTDNTWVQIVLTDGKSGWVSARYLSINIDLNPVSITGEAVDTTWPTAVSMVSPSGVEVITGITAHARQIYLDGQAKGNLPGVFSKVGDSITVSPYFFHQLIDVYNLADYGYLYPALTLFYGPNGRGGNPFSTNSIAAGNGWSTTNVLNPDQADPSLCRSGETPLQCEYRVSRPSAALIMFGTNDSASLPLGQYQANLNRIVEISISMGVIPILSTIPPMHYEPARDGRIADFNNIIIGTARTYDIPLWNYWRVMEDLPGNGLGFDGVHPSSSPDGLNAHFDQDHLKYGYTMRNLTGLQVLYQLWQQVMYDAVPGQTGNPVPTQPVIRRDATSITSGNPTCSGAAAVQLTIGGSGRVTPGVPNKMRDAPSLSAVQVGTIPGEAIFIVVGGPQCADGYEWWQINYNGLVGWTASGTSSELWVEPHP